MNGTRGVFFIALGVLIPLAACDAGSDRGPVAVSVPEAPLAIESIPVVSVGVLGGDTLQEFTGVVTPFVLPDGRLVVPSAGSADIRVFTPEGAFVERLGGRGEGPGEFGFLSAAWPRADTIEAFDGRFRRITRFLPGGTVEVIPIASGAHPDLVGAAGPLGQGWALGGVESGGQGQRDVMAYSHFDRDGTHLGELASSGGIIRYAGGNYGGPEPLSPRSVLRSDGTLFYYGDTLEPLIRSVHAPGIVDAEIAWVRPEGLSAETAFDRVVDEAVSRAASERAQETRQRFRTAPVPDQLSVFWDFHVDPSGFLWIQPYEPMAHAFALGVRYIGGVGSGGVWRVMTRDGRFAGLVEVPDGLEVTQITRSSVVGIRRNAFGVESVHVHHVNRRRQAE